MDDADRVTQNEAIVTASLVHLATKPVRGLKPVGYCHYCLEDLDDNKVFCNANHAASHEQQQRLRSPVRHH